MAGLPQARAFTQKDTRRAFPGDVRPWWQKCPGKHVPPGVLQEYGERGMKTVYHIINPIRSATYQA
ncbi:hypothetical protein [Bacteroides cutis]|uniref:hypothetical protein n=1 Tax=Bacteroides cutis TaxID=2024197 RepID=UPI0023A893C5|nr:hypothetical protein [Bacteroides cutis]